MKPIDFLLLAAVILLVLLALRTARGRAKNGCCGSGGASSCGGNCARSGGCNGCSGCGRTVEKGTIHKGKKTAAASTPRSSACPHCASQTSKSREYKE